MSAKRKSSLIATGNQTVWGRKKKTCVHEELFRTDNGTVAMRSPGWRGSGVVHQNTQRERSWCWFLLGLSEVKCNVLKIPFRVYRALTYKHSEGEKALSCAYFISFTCALWQHTHNNAAPYIVLSWCYCCTLKATIQDTLSRSAGRITVEVLFTQIFRTVRARCDCLFFFCLVFFKTLGLFSSCGKRILSVTFRETTFFSHKTILFPTLAKWFLCLNLTRPDAYKVVYN